MEIAVEKDAVHVLVPTVKVAYSAQGKAEDADMAVAVATVFRRGLPWQVQRPVAGGSDVAYHRRVGGGAYTALSSKGLVAAVCGDIGSGMW